MSITLVRTVDPATEPVALSMAKTQCVIDAAFTDDDELISTLIAAAREYCENYTSRAFIAQTWRYSLDAFPWYGSNIQWTDRFNTYQRAGLWSKSLEITLPRPPLISITSVDYLDVDGTLQTIDPSLYVVDSDSEPARVVPSPGNYWPYPQLYRPNTVQITYQAGYSGTLPARITQAMLLLISHWYQNRETTGVMNLKEIPFATTALLDTLRIDLWGFGND